MAATSPDRAKSEIAQPKPRRFGRWFRFSLATMFVAVTIGCIWLGWFVNRIHHQQQAVAMVVSHGGWITYDYQDTSWASRKSHALAPLPAWIEETVGVDCFSGVTKVSLTDNDTGDAELALLGNLRSLRSLSLTHCRPTKDGLNYLRGFKRLENINIVGSQVNDEWITCLAGAPLESLSLDHSRVSGHGLACLENCDRLWELRLYGSTFDDNDLMQMPAFPNLSRLNLCRTPITSDGLKHLPRQPSLTSLDVCLTAIDDIGLDVFLAMPNLEDLDLRGTNVTRQGVKRLEGLRPNLKVCSLPLRNEMTQPLDIGLLPRSSKVGEAK